MERLHAVGWVLFMVSAVAFAGSGVRSGDWFVVAGSVIFGVACLLFLIPARR